MSFDEDEKDIVIVDKLEKTYEDIQLEIKKPIKAKNDVNIENCTLIFDLSSNASINSDGRSISIVDSEIIFKGEKSNVALNLKKCNLHIENCRIIQEETSDKYYTVFFQNHGKGRIEIDDCNFSNMRGQVIQAIGSDVYIENTKASNCYGGFCNIVYLEDKMIYYPILSVKSSVFEYFDWKDAKDDYEKCKVHSDKSGTFFINGENNPTVIECEDCSNIHIENSQFMECKIQCIRFMANCAPVTPSRANIINCDFTNCNQKNEGWQLPHTAILDTVNLSIDNCRFNSIDSIYILCRFYPMKISKCHFVKCGGKHKVTQSAVLEILDDIDEPIAEIRDCVFDRCKVNGVFDDSNESENSMIRIRAGMPETSQKYTVRISGCSFKNCKCDNNIDGKEKQDGFFGQTITFYKIED